MWINCKDSLPPMFIVDTCAYAESVPVLGVVYGRLRVVKLEQWDEDCPAQWYSDCSEHWNLDDAVTHWQPLPDLPETI
jgi:hypothetical protein